MLALRAGLHLGGGGDPEEAERGGEAGCGRLDQPQPFGREFWGTAVHHLRIAIEGGEGGSEFGGVRRHALGLMMRRSILHDFWESNDNPRQHSICTRLVVKEISNGWCRHEPFGSRLAQD